MLANTSSQHPASSTIASNVSDGQSNEASPYFCVVKRCGPTVYSHIPVSGLVTVHLYELSSGISYKAKTPAPVVETWAWFAPGLLPRVSVGKAVPVAFLYFILLSKKVSFLIFPLRKIPSELQLQVTHATTSCFKSSTALAMTHYFWQSESKKKKRKTCPEEDSERDHSKGLHFIYLASLLQGKGQPVQHWYACTAWSWGTYWAECSNRCGLQINKPISKLMKPQKQSFAFTVCKLPP